MKAVSMVSPEDRDFILRALTLYRGLGDENQNLVLAFLRGIDFQKALGKGDSAREPA